MKRLLASADGDDERLLVLLGAYGGLRAAEMVGLRWADVDLDAGRLVVKRGKRGKRRTIPLAPLLAPALAAIARSSAFVLALEQERRTAGTAQIRYSAASSRLKRACKRAGVPPRGLDALRHNAGTRLNEQSGDVGLVSRLLGHESTATSTIYSTVVFWGPWVVSTTLAGSPTGTRIPESGTLAWARPLTSPL